MGGRLDLGPPTPFPFQFLVLLPPPPLPRPSLGLLLSSLSSQAPWKTRKWRKHRVGSPRGAAPTLGWASGPEAGGSVLALPRVWRGSWSWEERP